MSKARIVIFSWAESVHVQRWARGLSERGYTVKVISPGGEPIDGIETAILPHRAGWSYFINASAAAKEAHEFNPDLVHVHYAGGMGLWGLRTGCHPMVVSVWGTDVISGPKNPFYRLLIRRMLRRANAVTATSNLLREVTIGLQPSTREKISVIPFGVEIPPDPLADPPPKPIRVCYLKMHEPRYAPGILLKAMALVKKRIGDLQLNMVGEGSLTGSLRRMIADLGLEDNVHLLGFIKNTGIYEFIGSHHFMVMPSLSEAFGVAVLEAGACHRPTIASRVGGVPEVLVDGETGILVDRGEVDQLADAIIRLAENADLRNRMGDAAYRFVKEHYTWEKSLDMMTALYERLLHEKS